MYRIRCLYFKYKETLCVDVWDMRAHNSSLGTSLEDLNRPLELNERNYERDPCTLQREYGNFKMTFVSVIIYRLRSFSCERNHWVTCECECVETKRTVRIVENLINANGPSTVSTFASVSRNMQTSYVFRNTTNKGKVGGRWKQRTLFPNVNKMFIIYLINF